jgi:hypothetical protein
MMGAKSAYDPLQTSPLKRLAQAIFGHQDCLSYVVLYVFFGLVEDKAVAIEVASEKLRCCAPQIEAELSILKIAEHPRHKILVGLKLLCPLSKRKVIAPSSL